MMNYAAPVNETEKLARKSKRHDQLTSALKAVLERWDCTVEQTPEDQAVSLFARELLRAAERDLG